MTGLVASLEPAWAWLVAGLILMGGELALPGVFLIWLGLAACLTGAFDWLEPLPWQAQLLLFAALSVIAVLVGRQVMRGAPSTLSRRADALLGRDFALDTAISGGFGRVRLDDSVWRVAGPETPAGTRVRVVAIDGATLVVVPLPATV